MKKLMITLAAVALTLGAVATEVQYKDVVNNDAGTSNILNKIGVTFETKSEIKDLKFANTYRIANLAIKKNIYSEVDDFAATASKEVLAHDNWIVSLYVNKTRFPKWFAKELEYFYSTLPVTKALFNKYGVLQFSKDMTCNEILAVINAGELKSIRVIDSLNNNIKNEGVKIVKKYLRSKGMTFVSSKKKVNGQEVLINPLEAPMKELTDALNGARYAGFNAWIDKYGASWTKIDLSWMESEAEMKAIMDDILIDEKKMNDYSVKLRLHLGVDGFNAFVKEYNEGVTK